MPIQHVNGIDICYDTLGDHSGRPLVLIMGLATSMIAWPERLCAMLAEAGHFVVRFDNRDVGLSSWLAGSGVPDLDRLTAERRAGRCLQVPYTLSDMAGDTLGLMDALCIDRAHVCGTSMGGMIGQVMAIEHPERMASLVSLMSTTSEVDLPKSTPAAQQAMMAVAPATRAEYQAYQVAMLRAFSEDSELLDEALQRRIAGQAFDLGLSPEGFYRQMAAIMAAGGRRRLLQQVSTPTLVLHGDHDAVIPLAHGQDTAQAIRGARLIVLPGLGHGLAFPTLWPQIVAEIAAHTTAAARTAPRS